MLYDNECSFNMTMKILFQFDTVDILILCYCKGFLPPSIYS